MARNIFVLRSSLRAREITRLRICLAARRFTAPHARINIVLYGYILT